MLSGFKCNVAMTNRHAPERQHLNPGKILNNRSRHYRKVVKKEVKVENSYPRKLDKYLPNQMD